jgi:hypothetical protein
LVKESFSPVLFEEEKNVPFKAVISSKPFAELDYLV